MVVTVHDIMAQVEVDGTVRIVDRKKDLVKLQFGEYVLPLTSVISI